ncbi:MAG: 6-phosphogluconolactonase [Acidimicrobiia bacterium]
MAGDPQMNGEIHVVDDVPRSFAEFVTQASPSSLALSGGDTARQAYEQLATANLPWNRIDVFFGDERWVPVDDAESNEHLARRTLLDRVQPRSVHSMRSAGGTPGAAADAYEVLLRAHGPLDLVHLGLGPDGHTASLFPGSEALAVRNRLVVTTGDDLHPHPRLTVTYPALEQALLVLFTVSGQGKRAAFARVQSGDDVPAARVDAERVVWLVDRAAAGR